MTVNARFLSVTATAALLISLGGAATGAADPAAAPRDRCTLPGPYELPHGSRRVDLDPDDFTARIDNPYWPMVPGTRWIYREHEDGERVRIEVTVLARTRTVRGIEARVVHDVATQNGELVEDTHDWYAQDSGGSIWYLGEHTTAYEDGEPPSTAGSWEYGVDGAQAGVAVPASPTPGCSYRQEFYAGQAEDRGRVLSVHDDLQIRGTRHRNVLSTSDWTPVEPYVLEHKFYARGVGPVLTVGVSPSPGRETLLHVRPPQR